MEALTTWVGFFLISAPEIIAQQPYDYKVDCWSIGVMLFEFLSGEYPFNTSKGESDLFNAIQNSKFSFNENWDSISDEAKDLVKGLLEKDPSKRLSIPDVEDHPWMQKF